jgi:tetratricopeptide (TPR) repeat protein
MSNVRGKIFCQRCKSPNEMGEDLCGRCGTRLMLLVEPSAARFEGRAVGGEKEGAEEEGGARLVRLREEVLARSEGGEQEVFAELVRKGFAELEKGRSGAALRALERAAALAPTNAPLNAFLGEQLFGRGKTAPARDYLERALAAEPESGRLRLLLGLACGDEGETERALSLIREAVELCGHSFAAHSALGRLAAAESDWKGALAEFKAALAARPSPEAHYLVGLANFRLGRNRAARQQLTKAVGLDSQYGAAFYLLGLVRMRLGEREEGARAFESAAALGACENLSDWAEAPDPEPFVQKGRGRARLLTGGDERLAAALREDALGGRAAR